MDVALRGLAMLAVLTVAACAVRPGPQVLRPTLLAEPAQQTVQVLVATNRSAEPAGPTGLARAAMSFEQYTISVPARIEAGHVAYPSGEPDPSRQYVVLERKMLSREAFLAASVVPGAQREKLSLFVHGYNQSYQEAIFRLAQVGADARSRAPMVLFAWPSEAELLGYVADKDAVLASRGDLRLLIADLARMHSRSGVMVAGHSMGGFLVMEAIRELRLAGRQDVLDRLSVALAAPDIDTEVFRAQLETIGQLREPIVVVVSRNDQALRASSLLGSERPRIGLLDVEDPKVQALVEEGGIYVLDITALDAPDRFNHEGYAALARYSKHFSTSQPANLTTAAELGLLVFRAPGIAVARAVQ